jgi:hypothetical protein
LTDKINIQPEITAKTPSSPSFLTNFLGVLGGLAVKSKICQPISPYLWEHYTIAQNLIQQR